jgi:hypothetical protein
LKGKEKPKVKKTLPFTKQNYSTANDELYTTFSEALRNLCMQIPLADAIKISPYTKFLRDILNKKQKITQKESVAMIMSYPLENKVPTKLGDLGIPTIFCSIGKMDIHTALSDLGAVVSVMPFSLYEKLNLGDYTPTSITMQMADKSTKQPVSMMEEVLLRLDQHVIRTDFIILDIPEVKKVSIISKRPFLSTPRTAVY